MVLPDVCPTQYCTWAWTLIVASGQQVHSHILSHLLLTISMLCPALYLRSMWRCSVIICSSNPRVYGPNSASSWGVCCTVHTAGTEGLLNTHFSARITCQRFTWQTFVTFAEVCTEQKRFSRPIGYSSHLLLSYLSSPRDNHTFTGHSLSDFSLQTAAGLKA